MEFEEHRGPGMRLITLGLRGKQLIYDRYNFVDRCSHYGAIP